MDKMTSDFVEKKFNEKIEQSKVMFLDQNWNDQNFYAAWLAQTHHFVTHTISFLALLVARYGKRQPQQCAHVLQHLREEQGHDKLLINDLKALGRKVDEFPEYPETRAFYQSQYYWIEHVDPAAHMGYSLYLEGLATAVCGKVHSQVTKTFEKTCGSFLKVHAVADEDHFPEGCKELKKFSAEQLKYVLQNLDQSAALYEQILQRLNREYGSQKTKVVA